MGEWLVWGWNSQMMTDNYARNIKDVKKHKQSYMSIDNLTVYPGNQNVVLKFIFKDLK